MKELKLFGQRVIEDLGPAPKLLEKLGNNSESSWLKRGETMALNLFNEMSVRVPAYRDMLKKHDINPAQIKNAADLKHLPLLDKDNYLRAYSREDLCWDGHFNDQSWVISSTSGSTGLPYYFPRKDLQDDQYALTAELYLRSNFNIHKLKTLYIDAFAMGVWIGGLFTYEAVKKVAERGYNLSIITPGINKSEVIKAIKNLGDDFDQVIIGCYPPVLKDIVDDGIAEGLDWKKYKVGFVFSAEGFSENFRDYIIEKAGLSEPYISTLNHYGTVDLGTMSHETPLAIWLRRLAVSDPQIYDAVFGQVHRLPTLTQYLPELFYFEEEGGNLLCSSYSGIPLLRYDLKDHGGVFSLQEISIKLEGMGINITEELKKAGIAETIWNLPFVYLYERSDFSVSFLGFQVYPEPIRKAAHKREVQNYITGKFTMIVEYDGKNQQTLQIHIELKSGQQPTSKLQNLVEKLIIDQLKEDNSIYKMNYDQMPERVKPVISFWEYEHPLHFGLGGKQKWVKK
jgi:phenylacetate-CoA ligase